MCISKKYRFLKATSKVYRSGVILFIFSSCSQTVKHQQSCSWKEKNKPSSKQNFDGTLNCKHMSLNIRAVAPRSLLNLCSQTFCPLSIPASNRPNFMIQEIFSSLTKALEAHTHCVFVLFISLWCSGFIFVKIYTRARDWSDWRRHLFPHERAHLKRRSCDCLSWLQMLA